MDLEEKCEAAMVAFLQSAPGLQGAVVAPQNSELDKPDGCLVVAANRQAESIPDTGIYDVEVTVTFRLAVDRRKRTLTKFSQMVRQISLQLEREHFSTATLLTKATPQFHCYYYALQSVNKAPEDDKHQCVWTCQMQAMPITYGQGEINPRINPT